MSLFHLPWSACSDKVSFPTKHSTITTLLKQNRELIKFGHVSTAPF